MNESRLINMQYQRNEIAFRKLNKVNRESNKSMSNLTRAMTIDEDFKKPSELLASMKK